MSSIPIPPSQIRHRSTSPPSYQLHSPFASTSMSSPSRAASVPIYDEQDIYTESVASSSRTAQRRVRSSSTATSPSASHTLAEASTAPTTPEAGPQRFWHPTPNVPFHISQRHQIRRISPSGEGEEHNRWLSEDEGLGGVGSSTRRRKRRSSTRDRLRGGGDDIGVPDTNPAESSPAVASGLVAARKAGTEAMNAARRRNKRSTSRPNTRRSRSVEPPIAPAAGPSTMPSIEQHVGYEPPRIEDIVPAPSAAGRATGLGLSTLPGSTETVPLMASIDRPNSPPTTVVPDFAAGRGGDGIGGIGLPSEEGANIPDERVTRRESEKDMLRKLRRILGCALCPPSNGELPPLHRPITLPCGHTLSAEHIRIPTPAPLVVNSDLPHEVAAAQTRHQQQRLNLWAGIMCPIPSCKRYSPDTGVTTFQELPLDAAPVISSPNSGALRGAVLASGVAYYPPPQPAPPPAYAQEGQTTTVQTSPLLDVCVEKTLQIVLRELERDEQEKFKVARDSSPGADDESSDDETASHSSLSPRIPALVDPELSPVAGRKSKRRRNDSLGGTNGNRQASLSPDAWPFQRELAGLLECDVCAMLLHEPVTTPCQHSFCAKCLSRSLDHSFRCPVCRQDLPSFASFQDHSVNMVLLTIIKTAFPDEYAERQQAIERDERDARLETPIFVCTLAFPGMPTILHVFEPRYRLMIRRCIESSSPRFGMLLPARATGAATVQGVSEYGTMLEIQSVQMLPDGRSMVETVGTHRFKLIEKGNHDGYTVGRIERIDDITSEDEASLEREAVARAAEARAVAATLQPAEPVQPAELPEPGVGIPLATQPAVSAEDAAQTTEEYMSICRAFIEQLRSGSAPWLLQRLNNTYGTMPIDPSEFSYWMALVMPIDEYEKARLLPIRSPRLRLKVIVHWIESLRSSWW